MLQIPDDEADVAVRNLIKSTKILVCTLETCCLKQIPEVEKQQESGIPPILIQKRQTKKPFTLVNPTDGESYQIIDLDELDVQQSDVVVSQKIGSAGGMPFHLLTLQNIANFTAMTQNVPGTSQSMLNFMATPHNIAGASQNVIITSQNVVGAAQSAVMTGQSAINPPQNVSSAGFIIPDGFKNTKYPDTLEKIDLSSSEGQKQKAAKWFFCLRCMKRGVESGYTKRNDLNKHLEGCGTTKEKKFKCTYQGCTESYVRSDNLRQHVSRVHTKIPLYTCKKCNKGFFTSKDASIHRKECFPGKPEPTYTEEESKVTAGTKDTEENDDDDD